MPEHCPNRTVLGILNQDGAMADFVSVPLRNLHEVPEVISDEEAVFIEPLAAAFQMIEQVRPGPGMRLAIVGDGKLGLLCTWVVRLSGAEVHLIGKHSEKLALAGDGVSTHTLDEIESLTRSFDVVVESTGSATGLPTALRLVRPRGTIVLKTTIAGRYDIDLSQIVIDEIRVQGSRCGPFPRAIGALAARQVPVNRLIGATYSLDKAEDAFRAAAEPGAKKVLLKVR